MWQTLRDAVRALPAEPEGLAVTVSRDGSVDTGAWAFPVPMGPALQGTLGARSTAHCQGAELMAML